MRIIIIRKWELFSNANENHSHSENAYHSCMRMRINYALNPSRVQDKYAQNLSKFSHHICTLNLSKNVQYSSIQLILVEGILQYWYSSITVFQMGILPSCYSYIYCPLYTRGSYNILHLISVRTNGCSHQPVLFIPKKRGHQVTQDRRPMLSWWEHYISTSFGCQLFFYIIFNYLSTESYTHVQPPRWIPTHTIV